VSDKNISNLEQEVMESATLSTNSNQRRPSRERIHAMRQMPPILSPVKGGQELGLHHL